MKIHIKETKKGLYLWIRKDDSPIIIAKDITRNKEEIKDAIYNINKELKRIELYDLTIRLIFKDVVIPNNLKKNIDHLFSIFDEKYDKINCD